MVGVGAGSQPSWSPLASVTSLWPIVGRGEELAVCEACLQGGGTPGVVVAGAPGVGKTRLVREVLAAAEELGWVTVRATATVAARAIPLGALSHLLPAESGRPPTALGLLREARLVLGERSPRDKLVLCVDDAHLLDPASATLVHQLVAGGGVVVFLTLRSGEPVPDAVTALWKDCGCSFLELQPLSRVEAGMLLESVLGGGIDGRTEHALWEASRGTPLVLRELVLDGVERGVLAVADGLWCWQGELQVGRRLRELIAARIGEVDGAGRSVLEAVAFAGSVGLAWLEDSPALDGLISRGVLEVYRDGRRIEARFAHPLHGEVVRAGTSLPRAIGVLGRLADGLEASGARRRGDLLRLASWRLESGGGLSPERLVLAAQRAELAYAPALAERFAVAAEEAGGGFAARYAVARAVAEQGRLVEAEHLLRDLEGATVTDDERAMVAESRSRLLAGGLGRGEEAIAVIVAARATIADSIWSAKLALAEGWVRFRLGDPAAAADVVATVVDDIAVEESLRVSAAVFRTQMLAQVGRTEQAVALGVRWRSVADRLPEEFVGVRVDAAYTQTIALLVAGRMSEAGLEATRLYEGAIARGDLDMIGRGAFQCGLVALNRGQVREALNWLRESVHALGDADTRGMLPWALAMVAQAAGQAGETSEAVVAAAAAAAADSSGSWIYSAGIQLAHAWASASAGALSEAQPFALTAAETCEHRGQLTVAFMDFNDLARIGGSSVAAPRLQRLAQRVEGPWVRACAQHATALATQDAEALRASGRAFEQIGALLFAAEAMTEAATAFGDDGRASSARACATHAQTLLEHCDGARTPALSAAHELVALTSREREIATLAGGGLSNKAIASRLVLSPRTVENHLQQAYRKLGVTRRSELASLLETDRVE